MSNRQRLANQLAATLGVPSSQSSDLLVTVTEVLREHLFKEGSAVLPGFGRLKVVQRPARRGRNPRTGETIEVGPKDVVKFKPVAVKAQ